MPDEFDRLIDRDGTHSLKWEYRRPCRTRDIIPLWVADMDFASPMAVRDAVRGRAAHGIYGYTLLPDSYYRAVIDWMHTRFGWEIHKKWIVFTPGVVPAVNFAVQAFTEPGDGVIIQPPVYYPFELAVRNNGRELIHNPLQIQDGRYRMDFKQLRTCFKGRTKLLILCSPHNPVGRVWRREELRELAEICRQQGVLILSDEIHADLVSPTHSHIPLAVAAPEQADDIITCTSPNKTFNIAGLQTANTIIPRRELRKCFQDAAHRSGFELANSFAPAAVEAAYTEGREWLSRLIQYIWNNYAFVQDFFASQMPELRIFPLEGTYLVWIDGREVHPDDKKLKDIFLAGGVWLDEGSKFGPGGRGFLRMNIACPRGLLDKALARMAAAVSRGHPPRCHPRT